MKSGFIRVSNNMADPEPQDPTPAIPIKIITDTVASSADNRSASPAPASSSKRIDAFYPAWDQFLAVEPKRAKKTSRIAQAVEDEQEAVRKSSQDGLHTEQNAARSWEQAAEECKAKVAAIVEESKRLNQKYRDALFDLEASPYCLQSLNGVYPKAVDKIDAPPWIKRVEDIFDAPQFFIDGASATDVHQGSNGDCWFLAALMAVSAKKDLIEKLCVARDEKVGVYGFVFYRDGEWIYEVIDDKLYLRVGDDDDLNVVRDWDKEGKEGNYLYYDDEKLKNALQRGGEALYFSHCKSNETWLPLIEKAYAKAHGDYYAIEGGFASEGIEDITGGVAVVINPENILDKDRFWKEELLQVNKKYLFGGGSKPTSTKGFVGSHAYAILEAWEEGNLRLLKLRNPWGEVEWDGDWSDGSKLWTADMMMKLKHTFGDDGVFWIAYKDFLKHFPSINRVRLFDDTWTIAQQWTCVSVPWTVDYLDTKFSFTVSEKGPVVVVLNQPDDRYFYGLRGRYLYSLHFRVYKEGECDNETRWIVRSMHNSGNETIFTRSVSAEIEDLEPGTYDVIFKVTATRSTMSSTADEVIQKFALDRKEKLLNVGRRFDYAQTKGNLRGAEREIKKRKKQDKKDRSKYEWKRTRRLNKQDRERARLRKKRVDDAMKEKRKACYEKQKEKNKARRERTKAKRKEKDDEDVNEGAASTDNGFEKVEASQENLEKPTSAPPPKEGDEVSPKDEHETAEEASKPASEEKKDAADSEGIERDISAENLTRKLSTMALADRKLSHSDVSPIEEEDEDEDSEYESPVESPDELEDDDFEWDSEMDGPIDSSDDDSEASARRKKSKNEIFGDDSWTALCVLGLRVYSKNKDVRVRVVKGEDGA